MSVDSLVKLRSLFLDWRRRKAYAREPVPTALMERAQRAVAVHGVGAVIRATGIPHRRFAGRAGARGKAQAAPLYSRIEMPATPTRPLCEAETPSGVKIRVFAITAETIGLLSGLSGPGRTS